MRNKKWTEEAVIKNVLDNKGCGGPVLMNDGYDKCCYTGEGHTMYLGISGAGKSRRGTIPLVRSLIDNGESLVVIDPKGEITDNTIKFAEAKNYDINVINFRDINNSTRYNPLYCPAKLRHSKNKFTKQLSEEMVQEFVDTIIADDYSNVSDPYWHLSAKQLLIGTIDMMIDMLPAKYVTMDNALRILTSSPSIGSTKALLKHIYDTYTDRSPIVWQKLNSFMSAPDEKTSPCILSTLIGICDSFVKSPGLTEFLNGDDFHPYKLDPKKPSATYIIIPDETNCYNKIAGYLVSDISKYYLREAHDTFNGKLPIRINFVLEELGNIGKSIPNLPHLMSAGRSRNLRVQFVLQSITQLESLYSTSNSQTILSNTDIVIAYRINDLYTLNNLSEKCGYWEKTKASGQTVREAIISPSDLGALGTGQALVMISGRYKFITNLDDYSDMYEISNTTHDLSPYKRKSKFKSFETELNDILQRSFHPATPLPPVEKDSKPVTINISGQFCDIWYAISALCYIRTHTGNKKDSYPSALIFNIQRIKNGHLGVTMPLFIKCEVPLYLFDWIRSNLSDRVGLNEII